MDQRIVVSTSPLEPATVEHVVAAPGCGGRVVFTGVVRDHHRGLAVRTVHYEAYVPMAERVLGDIAREAAERFDIGAVAVHHRIGDLEVGEVAVVVAVGAAHRAPAFEACRYVIDETKCRVPIWKKEIYVDGEAWLSPHP